MAKNEAERIVETTLISLRDYCSGVILYDTGSTDNTIEVIEKFCKENDLVFNLKQGTFVNFCISRNVLLDFCDEIYPNKDTYLLLFDAHDELQEGDRLVQFIDNYKGTCSGFYITQRWYSGNNLDSYYNVRMVKSNYAWRYKGVVHEYILTPLIEIDKKPDVEVIYRLEGVYLFQDRCKDSDSSFKRFSRDKQLLYEEYVKDQHEPRTLFYLAQTCSCLGLHEESYKFYILRIKETGFYEEIYQSFFRLGEISQTLGHDWEESMTWYLKAFQHSQRAEPLVKIAEYYKDNNLQTEKKSEWHTCYMYANMACQLIFPVTQILFVDRRVYTYKRHHLLGMAAFYVGRYKEGKEACLKALESENQEIDRFNLKFYLEKELDTMQGTPLTCPALIAVSFGDKEMRAKDELEVKHDRNKIIEETISKIAEEKRKDSKPISSGNLEILRRNNVSSIVKSQDSSSPTVMTNAAGGSSSLLDQVQLAKMPRKDRRARLREMVKQKKLGKA